MLGARRPARESEGYRYVPFFADPNAEKGAGRGKGGAEKGRGKGDAALFSSFPLRQVAQRSENELRPLFSAEPKIPQRVKVPDYAHRLPEPIRKFTGTIQDAEPYRSSRERATAARTRTWYTPG
jgi:hypothetical protein